MFYWLVLLMVLPVLYFILCLFLSYIVPKRILTFYRLRQRSKVWGVNFDSIPRDAWRELSNYCVETARERTNIGIAIGKFSSRFFNTNLHQCIEQTLNDIKCYQSMGSKAFDEQRELNSIVSNYGGVPILTVADILNKYVLF